MISLLLNAQDLFSSKQHLTSHNEASHGQSSVVMPGDSEPAADPPGLGRGAATPITMMTHLETTNVCGLP